MNQNLHKTDKRQQIIESAYKVFYESGFHAAGVDSLLIDTGISKRTLYKYFRSKEELVAATIGYYQELTFLSLIHALEAKTDDPKQKIIEIFISKKDAFNRGDFTGCFAMNAKLEFEGKNPLIEKSCTNFVRSMEAYIEKLCHDAKLADPSSAASKIIMLLQGTIVYAQSSRNPAAVDNALDFVRDLLCSHP